MIYRVLFPISSASNVSRCIERDRLSRRGFRPNKFYTDMRMRTRARACICAYLYFLRTILYDSSKCDFCRSKVKETDYSCVCRFSAGSQTAGASRLVCVSWCDDDATRCDLRLLTNELLVVGSARVTVRRSFPWSVDILLCIEYLIIDRIAFARDRWNVAIKHKDRMRVMVCVMFYYCQTKLLKTQHVY